MYGLCLRFVLAHLVFVLVFVWCLSLGIDLGLGFAEKYCFKNFK